jgi:CubicO group peptidase (beta-lactamase class C family)
MPKNKARKESLNLQGFDAFVRKQLRDWGTPAASLAIVHNGEVVLSRGYGFSNIRKSKEATATTVFPIASVTKAFSSFLLGLLVDEGKLEWDRPVREYLPDFKLFDSVTTEKCTVIDLLCHRTGVPRHDGLWYYTKYSRREMYDRLRYLQPSKDFRDIFQYNNLMYMSTGILVEKLTGKSWEDMIKERIFEPLKMTGSYTGVEAAMKDPEHVTPYTRKNNVPKQTKHCVFDPMGPCGTINSNVEDMSRWLQLHLNGGKLGRRALISPASLRETHKPRMAVETPDHLVEMPMSSYGLGWSTVVYRGCKKIAHSGGIDGIRTLVSFMPQRNSGLVILTNGTGPVPEIIERNIFDRMLELTPVAWSRRLKAVERKAKETNTLAKRKKAARRKKNTKPSHPLKDYVGVYEHPAYGTVSIEKEGRGIKLTWHRVTGTLKHYHYDTFDLKCKEWGSGDSTLVHFQAGLKGEIASLTIRMEPTVDPVLFKR